VIDVNLSSILADEREEAEQCDGMSESLENQLGKALNDKV
jgi:hypothetical protein